MIEHIEWLRYLILEHESLEYLIIFLGSTFGGEPALYILGFLAAQDVVQPISILIFGFIGTFIPNILWFILGNTEMANRIIQNRYAKATINLMTHAVRKISRRNHFVALTIIKFLVGTPFVLMIYINKTNLSFSRFMYYEAGALLISMLVIVPIGFFSGLGFNYFSDIFNSIYAAIGFLFLIVVIVIVVQAWFEKKFAENLE